ncbi:MAG: response regulator transcription factor [Microbacterium sp.]|nr:response regulator transcription factor [Microbacterium sp.]
MSVRVLLVDDQELVRSGFRIIVDSEPGLEVVGEARDGAEALEQVAALSPDVVCMDVQMPDLDGLEATRRLTASGANARVLILTTFGREDYLFAAIEAGASGFLLKNASAEELVRAIRVLADGEALLDTEVTRTVLERLATTTTAERRGAPTPDSAVDALTPRERDVLELVAHGLSNAEIAKALVVGEATVKTHVSNVLLKLSLRDRIQAVVWAYEHGVIAPAR